MKKVLFALAIAGMFGFAACNNAEENTDSTAIDTTTVEAVVADTTACTDSAAVECQATEVTENAEAAQ